MGSVGQYQAPGTVRIFQNTIANDKGKLVAKRGLQSRESPEYGRLSGCRKAIEESRRDLQTQVAFIRYKRLRILIDSLRCDCYFPLGSRRWQDRSIERSLSSFRVSLLVSNHGTSFTTPDN